MPCERSISEETIAVSLETRYLKLGGWVRELAAPLSEEQFWSKPFPFGNSFGNLVLHLTGNALVSVHWRAG